MHLLLLCTYFSLYVFFSYMYYQILSTQFLVNLMGNNIVYKCIIIRIYIIKMCLTLLLFFIDQYKKIACRKRLTGNLLHRSIAII